MKKFLIFAVIVLTDLTSISIIPQKTSGQKRKVQQAKNRIPNQYLVLLNEKSVGIEAVEPEVEARGRFLTSFYGGEISGVYSSEVKGFAVKMSAQQAVRMNMDESVRLIEEDQVVSASSTEMNAPWHLDRVDQRSLPIDTTYNYSSMGTGVNIYILDSGIRYTHVDFGGRADAVYDAIGDGQNGNDCYGHGTHVAGLAGSSTYGVAKNSRLHAVRVLNCSGQGTVSLMLSGIDWITAHRISPAVVNVSITVAGTSRVLETAGEKFLKTRNT